jgi:hypothetical protein
VGGVCAVLINPIVRLSAKPIEALSSGLTAGQWAVTVAWVAFMLYTEAYRGFHLQFAPRVVVRSLAIAHDPRPLPALLAPFTAMGLLWANRKRKIVAWSLVTMIVCIVLAVKQLDQPWRGIIDLGVVLGLSSGLGSVLWFAGRAVAGDAPRVPPDLPDDVPIPGVSSA